MKILILILLTGSVSGAMTLDQFLIRVSQKHKFYLAQKASLDVAEDHAKMVMTELSPALTLSGSYLDDQNPQIFGPFVLNRTQVTSYSMGLSKKFSSGTQASVSVGVSDPTLYAPSALETPVGSYSISLSQSLWKDMFGRSTKWRLERGRTVAEQEKFGYDLQLRQALIDAEATFWDYLYQKEELKQRQESLNRAKKIEGWVRRRAGNGIGDRSDVLTAKSLVASRELQLLSAMDDSTALEKKISDTLELDAGQKIPDLEGNISQLRPPQKLAGLENPKGRIVRLDSYLSVLEAKAKQLSSQEINDSMRPDLVLEGSYKTNNLESTIEDARSNIFGSSNPTAAISLKLVWMLDSDVKNATRDAAKKDALSAELKKQRKLLESETSWRELLRRHQELSKKVQAAEVLSEVQTSRAAAERDRLAKGRTLTSQVVQAEQDAAEAELNLSKMRAEQRKLESQGRMFVTVEGEP